jgi:tRNA threonylcarbamoyladenosine biosynthesis protein TsaB
MRILAIDTAMPAVSACVLDSSDKNPIASESTEMARGHAEALMPMIERIMAATQGGFASLDRIAVTVGPGSFTGIRVGLAAARAIGLATGKPVVGISTLSAFAAPLILAHDERPILACIDARHGQCYAQLFSGAGKIMSAPTVTSYGDAAAMLGARAGRLTGNAAPNVIAEAWGRGFFAEIVGEPSAPLINFVAMLGMIAEPGDSPPRPLYLKAVDATPMGGVRPRASA